MAMSGLGQFEQYNSDPMSFAKGKIFLSRGPVVDVSFGGFAAIGVPATLAVVMSNSSRMSVMYCPWSMVSIRLVRSRSILHPISHEEGHRSSIWKREEKFFLNVRMKRRSGLACLREYNRQRRLPICRGGSCAGWCRPPGPPWTA